MEQFAWGVDYSSKDVTLGCVDLDHLYASSHKLANPAAAARHPERFGELYNKTFALARTVAGICPPVAVAIEEPSRSRVVNGANAVVLAALHNAFASRGLPAPPLWPVHLQHWRRPIVGAQGGSYALKLAVKQWVKRTYRYAAPDFDHADAIGIAHWLKTNLKEES